MKVETLIGCHERAFAALGGVPKSIMYDNMKTVILQRDTDGEGKHRCHASFLDFTGRCGFTIKVCRPYRAKTKGKVERFNGYLRRSFYVPLASRLSQSGQQLDVVTANIEVARWLREVAHERFMARRERRRPAGWQPNDSIYSRYRRRGAVTWRLPHHGPSRCRLPPYDRPMWCGTSLRPCRRSAPRKCTNACSMNCVKERRHEPAA